MGIERRHKRQKERDVKKMYEMEIRKMSKMTDQQKITHLHYLSMKNNRTVEIIQPMDV